MLWFIGELLDWLDLPVVSIVYGPVLRCSLLYPFEGSLVLYIFELPLAVARSRPEPIESCHPFVGTIILDMCIYLSIVFIDDRIMLQLVDLGYL
jgi:hypothetical protein